MRKKPTEYIWLCLEHYDQKCKELGYDLPVMTLANAFRWKCAECNAEGIYLVATGKNKHI